MNLNSTVWSVVILAVLRQQTGHVHLYRDSLLKYVGLSGYHDQVGQTPAVVPVKDNEEGAKERMERNNHYII